jgi:ATP-dependent Lon protease
MMDALDRLANEVFGGRVVRKDLVREVKVGANVPVYVVEFLIGKYCASDDPIAIETGLEVVNKTLAENFIRPDESEKAKAMLKRKGQHRLIDKVSVRLLASEDKYWAELANFGDKYVHVPEEFVYKYDRLLTGGVWAQVELIYNADEEELHKRPFFIKRLKPIQVAAFSMEEWTDGRRRMNTEEWLDLLVRSVGLEPSNFSRRQKLLYMTRLIPVVERNYNLVELGPWGTGKSFVYRDVSPHAILISGGKTTVPQLFVNIGSGRVGLVGTWDVVAFDEVGGIQFSDPTVVQIMKDYMESGSFARGKQEIPAEASMVFLGNTSKATQQLVRDAHLFADLPKAMIDPAFLDRIHFYLPGWETPKMQNDLLSNNYGFVSDYLAAALRELRKQSFARALDAEFALGPHLNTRDEKAVRKTLSGMLKLLHPHGDWTRAELREYLEFAMEGRRRVKEQLKKLAGHDYTKTSFSYVERDTGRELWVEVPEQPEEEPVIEAGEFAGPLAAELPDPSPLSVQELLKQEESDHLELKASARWHLLAKRVDEAVELGVIKSVAGFLNAGGGTLLIGVNDEREPIGLAKDFENVRPQNRDGFENFLTTLLENALGSASLGLVKISWEQLDGQDICRVDAKPSPQPVFVKNLKMKTADLYVRTNNSTRLFNTEEAMTYVKQHWK